MSQYDDATHRIQNAYSDTTSPFTPLPNQWDLAQKLARRMGIDLPPNPSKWPAILLLAMDGVLDRLDALEQPKEDINRG